MLDTFTFQNGLKTKVISLSYEKLRPEVIRAAVVPLIKIVYIKLEYRTIMGKVIILPAIIAVNSCSEKNHMGTR